MQTFFGQEDRGLFHIRQRFHLLADILRIDMIGYPSNWHDWISFELTWFPFFYGYPSKWLESHVFYGCPSKWLESHLSTRLSKVNGVGYHTSNMGIVRDAATKCTGIERHHWAVFPRNVLPPVQKHFLVFGMDQFQSNAL